MGATMGEAPGQAQGMCATMGAALARPPCQIKKRGADSPLTHLGVLAWRETHNMWAEIKKHIINQCMQKIERGGQTGLQKGNDP